MKIVWPLPSVILSLHEMHIAEHGGLPGLRDPGGLESALARAANLLAYGEPDMAELAAAMAWGLIRNHPFNDGNKRTSLVTMELFLELNGLALEADDAECVTMFFRLAEGVVPEGELAEWIRAHAQPIRSFRR